MNLLSQLTVCGSLMFISVAILDRLCAFHVSARSRRSWWLLVPLAFLLTIPGWLRPIRHASAFSQGWINWIPFGQMDAVANASATRLELAGPLQLPFVSLIIVAGAAVYLLVALTRTSCALRAWGCARLSTDPVLLEVLEDCKSEAGITAPIGLVVSEAVAAPVILGWLRPRILLPAGLASSISREQLRAVLFHELAHFRSLDIPLNWLFTVVCALHWFNPFAHLAFRAWTHFAEEAADENAIAWLRQPSGVDYGETLLRVLRNASGQPAPFASLAIVESVSKLRNRITMIKHYEQKSPRYLLTGAISALAGFVLLLHAVNAAESPDDSHAIASGPMQSWLQEIDQGKYAQSWADAAPMFQKAVTSPDWTAKLTSVRTPLGKCTSRKIASVSTQKVDQSTGSLPPGDYIVAQFDTSFDGLKYAVETVSFEKAPDGTWKADGYYIKPKM